MARRSVADRFWVKVHKTEECWLWTAGTGNGYGRFGVSAGNVVQAHRWAYEQVRGPIPEGKVLDHACEQRLCVRPEHCIPMSIGQNVAFAYVQKTHCKHGHSLADALTHHGRRECRTCNRERCARRAAEKKELVSA